MTLTNSVRVWDIAIRIFHWSLVILFFTAYLTGEEESLVHVYAGYGVLGLVAFRIIWGFVGSKHARFGDFIYSPKTILGYAKAFITGKPQHYLGHNPLGGLMVMTLLAALLAVSWTGLKLYAEEGKGPLASNLYSLVNVAYADDDEHEANGHQEKVKGANEEWWEEIHEFFANFTLLLVFLHIGGVIIASLRHGENLIKAMITGKKSPPNPS